MKKLFIVLVTIGSIITYAIPVAAETGKHVLDCIDQEEGCLEPVEQQPNENFQQNNEVAGASQSSLFLNIVKMVIALLFVLALIYGLLLFIKKRNRLFQQVGILENLGGISVGQHKSIQIVRIGEKMYIVGVGENIALLEELTDETVKKQLLEKQETEFKTPLFLQSLLPQKRSENKGHHAFTMKLQKELANFKEQRHDFLKKLKDDDHV